MFKKNLYSFCALLALSCSAYAMEGLNEDSAPAKRLSKTLSQLPPEERWELVCSEKSRMMSGVWCPIESAQTRAVVMRLSKVLNCTSPDFSTHEEIVMGLRGLAQQAANELEIQAKKLKDLEAALETERAKNQHLLEAIEHLKPLVSTQVPKVSE